MCANCVLQIRGSEESTTVVLKKLETEVSITNNNIFEMSGRKGHHVRKLFLAESRVRQKHHSGRQQVGNTSQ